ncbi:MAG: type II toxin-antitoxin system VapC family toxin [Defluviitaleaceae bacterium]|nr:type II toxin-antitoxin system VapC family toxin [Defluviitaleaceae bacterium]
MKYLLDTHTALWYFEQSPRLSRKAERIIDGTENEIYVCAVSLWEISIKVNLAKLDLSMTLGKFFNLIHDRNFFVIPIKNEYMLNLLNVPYIHKDPFDRLIISTALMENLPIITADKNIQKYDLHWIW